MRVNLPNENGTGQGPDEEGQGVVHSDEYDTNEDGYKCLAKMPTLGGFFTRASRHGQP